MTFTWDWLLGTERKALRKLQVKEQELKNEILDIQIRESILKPVEKAYKSIRLLGNKIIVVFNDGLVMFHDTGGKRMYDQIRECIHESQVFELLMPKIEIKKSSDIETIEERELVRKEWHTLENHQDFEIKGDEIYLKGVSMPLPAMIVAAFIEIIDKLQADSWEDKHAELKVEYISLKMFTLKIALNPIQSSREDTLRFVKEHDIKITSLGNLIMYRRIVSIQGYSDKKLTKFVSEEYLKVKKWKKSVINYEIVKIED